MKVPHRALWRNVIVALIPAALVFFAATLPAQTASSDGGEGRATYNFNADWREGGVADPSAAASPQFDDAGWKRVTLPHAWNEDEAFRKPIHEHSTGVVWYRKRFTLPKGADGRKVFLEFEGVRQAADFFLNGERIGRHENGVMAFGFDISEHVRPAPQENVLSVRTDNDWAYRELSSGQRFQWSDKNFNANYGGIPKNVRLHIADQLHQTLPLYSHLGTTGVYVYATEFDIPGRAATITAEAEVNFEPRQEKKFSYEVTVADMDGKVVKTFSAGPFTMPGRSRMLVKASARIDGLNFWSWGYGYLYTVTTSLKVDGKVVDAVKTRTGFRKTEFANGVFKLNDRVLQIKGYAQRTSNEWPALGLSVPPWLSDYSNRLMVESNANTVRWMHVTPWKQDVESLDRVGLMMLMPAGDSERDAQGRLWAMRVELMRDAIIYNRNNPSVVFYESGNKGIDEEHMRDMVRLRDQYDPHGGRAMGSREMLDSKVAEWGGEMLYVNKSAKHPLFATEYSRDEGLRKYWDEFSPPFHKDGDGPLYNGAPARVYNRNQDTHAIENVRRWYDYWLERPGTGRRVNSGGLNIIFSDTNTHYRGAENYRRSGEVDAMRIPKDGFWAHQVMWDGWVDVEKPRIHIIGHWNYAPGTKKAVQVVSSADRVELLLNGRSLGDGKQSSRFLFSFDDVTWEAGEIKAVGYSRKGEKLCEAAHTTAGDPAALRLSSIVGPKGLKADGADVALFEVEVVDAKGRRCPTALNMVDFEISGPAEWRGGIAQGPDNYILAKSLPVEGGVNRVFVRSTTQAGAIAVKAASAGLRGASAEIVSNTAAQSGGLASALAADGLPSYLGRGPTPSTPAFKVSRLPVAIVNSTAGSQPERARLSYDDDETTSWTSDGGAARGWIEYELERPARLHEVTLRLSGWRERSYPVSVTADGQEIFRGVTPRGLGYVTLPLKRVWGKKIRIALIGEGEAKDSTGITELEDQKNASTGSERLTRNNLAVVEAEFYEPAPGTE